MNCRTVRMMAIAIGLCVITATASNALAAKDKAKHGAIAEAITMPKPSAGTSAAVPGSIKITETDKATKAETTNTYELSDAVSVQVDGEPAKLEDLAKGDKIGFKLTDGKVSVIMKGHKKKAPK